MVGSFLLRVKYFYIVARCLAAFIFTSCRSRVGNGQLLILSLLRMKNLFPRPAGRCLVLLLALLLPGAFRAAAQNVGIGTPSPTQKLDVDGNLRVRGLNGSTNRLPMILPDGTLGVNTSLGRGVPVPLGSVATDAGPQGLAVSGTLAYVVTQSHSLQVFNVASPSAPTPLGTASTGPNTFPVGVAVKC